MYSECDSYPAMPKVKPAKTDIRPDYSVGVNNCGGAVLMLCSEGTTLTLSMTEFGTRQLIKLLEATLPDEEFDA